LNSISFSDITAIVSYSLFSFYLLFQTQSYRIFTSRISNHFRYPCL